MTRDERIAAGWEECWGVFDRAEKQWMGTDRRFPHTLTPSAKRWGSSNHRVAANDAYQKNIGLCVPRPFWRRKKPKALKAGENVVMRGTFSQMGDNGPLVMVGGVTYCFPRDSVERVKP